MNLNRAIGVTVEITSPKREIVPGYLSYCRVQRIKASLQRYSSAYYVPTTMSPEQTLHSLVYAILYTFEKTTRGQFCVMLAAPIPPAASLY